MTYGANGGQLRDALATLLRQHRIQQRLGGAGSHTIPETTTVEERAALGALIARYRHAVLVHCRTSVTAVNPNTPNVRAHPRTGRGASLPAGSRGRGIDRWPAHDG